MVIEGSVSLASVNIVADEFFQSIGDGSVVYYFVDKCDDIEFFYVKFPIGGSRECL